MVNLLHRLEMLITGYEIFRVAMLVFDAEHSRRPIRTTNSDRIVHTIWNQLLNMKSCPQGKSPLLTVDEIVWRISSLEV